MKTPTSRRTLRTAAASAVTAGMLAMGAAAASAHVHVDPDDPAANGYTHLTFSVPNESPTAKTKGVEVRLPMDAPLTSVSVKPIEGWTARIITSKLPKPVTVDGSTVTKAPSAVVWSADAAHELGANEYQSFSLSVGKLPAAGTTVSLPVVQRYSDGRTVNWDEPNAPGKAEPEHPAPSFVTTAEDGAAAPDPAPSASATTSPAAVWGVVLGAAGLLLGAAALILVVAGRRGADGRNAVSK